MGLFKTLISKVAGIPNLKFIGISIVLVLSAFGLGHFKGSASERAECKQEMATAVVASKLDTIESKTRADVKQEVADKETDKAIQEEKEKLKDAEATGSNPLDAIF